MTHMNSPITKRSWLRSIFALSMQINTFGHDSNLLGDKASAKNEFLFADEGVLLPRPATILAWASLCALGPVNQKNFCISKNPFVVPFLPKIRFGEAVEQSLARVSKQHAKSIDGMIRWGRIFLASPISSQLYLSLDEGSVDPKEWANSNHQHFLNQQQLDVPPLYATFGEGFQFGVIQNIPGWTQSLREPFMMLAKNGIMQTRITARRDLQVRRLLMRFLSIPAAQTWAQAYSSAIHLYLESPTRVWTSDMEILIEEMRIRNERMWKAAAADTNKRGNKDSHKTPVFDLSLLESLMPDSGSQ